MGATWSDPRTVVEKKPCTCIGHRQPGVMHMVACCSFPHMEWPEEEKTVMPLFEVNGIVKHEGSLQVEAENADEAVRAFEEAMTTGSCDGLKMLDSNPPILEWAEVNPIDEVTMHAQWGARLPADVSADLSAAPLSERSGSSPEDMEVVVHHIHQNRHGAVKGMHPSVPPDYQL